MRHRNPHSTSCLSHHETVLVPYKYGIYTWTKSNKSRRYVQILQYVYDNPKCKRAEIIGGVFGWFKFGIAGYQSALFANMLYDDLIDYNTQYRYTITDKGLEILKESYIHDNLNLVDTKK